MNENKIKSTAEIVKECKAAGKSKEESWNAAYGGVNIPVFAIQTLQNDFDNLWNNA